MERRIELLVVLIGLWLCLCIGLTVAYAQVPPTPDVPSLSPEVADVIAQAEDTVQP